LPKSFSTLFLWETLISIISIISKSKVNFISFYFILHYPTSQKNSEPSAPPLANIFSCWGCQARAQKNIINVFKIVALLFYVVVIILTAWLFPFDLSILKSNSLHMWSREELMSQLPLNWFLDLRSVQVFLWAWLGLF
jgi:hypothetical protein